MAYIFFLNNACPDLSRFVAENVLTIRIDISIKTTHNSMAEKRIYPIGRSNFLENKKKYFRISYDNVFSN